MSKITLSICIVLCVSIISFIYFFWDLPDVTSLDNYEPPIATRLYSADGYILAEYFTEKRFFVPTDHIPDLVKFAFISAEDKNFYSHSGFDYVGILRAAYSNILYVLGKHNNIEGASTITQQVARYFLLTRHKTLKRKLREAALTQRIESYYDKKYILQLYLNGIYLGIGAYGVSVAALNYFGKPISELNLQEAAFLAAMPKAPARYDPIRNYGAAKIRRDWVIDRMIEEGYVSKYEGTIAKSQPILVSSQTHLKLDKSKYFAEEVRRSIVNLFGSDTLYNEGLVVKTTLNYEYQEYAYQVLRQAILRYDRLVGFRGPLFSYNLSDTNIDLMSLSLEGVPLWLEMLKNNSIALEAEHLVEDWFVGFVLDVQKDYLLIGLMNKSIIQIPLNLANQWARPYDPNVLSYPLKNFNNILSVGDVILAERADSFWLLRQFPEVNGGLLAMNHINGEILAMQGGFSFDFSEFNRTTQALRQPGSSFKAAVYLSGLENGMTNADLVLDLPFVDRDDQTNRVWQPRNATNRYQGFVTIRNAIERSRNLATINAARKIGLNNISKTSKTLGIHDDNLDDLTTVLGSKETTLLRMVRAYSIIANGGKEIFPHMVTMIQDRNGKIIYNNDNRYCHMCNDVTWQGQLPPNLENIAQQLIDSRDSFLMIHLLRGVVQNGSGRRAQVGEYNIAGKTGTSNESRDVWFIGFTPTIVMGVFLGMDDNTSLGKYIDATGLAAPIFSQFMEQVLEGEEILPFRTPNGIEMRWISATTGAPSSANAPGAILEAFRQEDGLKKQQSFVDEPIIY